MEFKNLYLRLCHEPKYQGPLPQVLKFIKEAMIAIDVDSTLPEELYPIIAALDKNKCLTAIRFAVAQEPNARLRSLRKKAAKSPIHDVDISSKLCRALSSTLHVSRVLDTLELPGLRFSVTALRVLARGIELSRTLKHLSLKETLLTDDGFNPIVSALLRNHSLIEVDLSSCGLSDQSADRIAELVESQARSPLGLLRIDLSDNGFTDQAAHRLASALRINHTVESMDLRHNYIEALGLRSVREMMTSNVSVVVDLRENPGILNALTTPIPLAQPQPVAEHSDSDESDVAPLPDTQTTYPISPLSSDSQQSTDTAKHAPPSATKPAEQETVVPLPEPTESALNTSLDPSAGPLPKEQQVLQSVADEVAALVHESVERKVNQEAARDPLMKRASLAEQALDAAAPAHISATPGPGDLLAAQQMLERAFPVVKDTAESQPPAGLSKSRSRIDNSSKDVGAAVRAVEAKYEAIIEELMSRLRQETREKFHFEKLTRELQQETKVLRLRLETVLKQGH